MVWVIKIPDVDGCHLVIKMDVIKDSREHITPILYRNEKVRTKGGEEWLVFSKRTHCVAQYPTLEDIAS